VLLHDLLAVFDSFEVRGESDPAVSEVDVSAIVHDDREVNPGALFCCIPGERVDGHDFVERAIANGAVACLVERFVPIAVPQVRVASVRAALGPLCSHFYGEPSRALRVMGVTGTNGKTTTTYLLESIARAAGERVALIGTIATRIDGVSSPSQLTTPEATELQRFFATLRDTDVGTVAMEVSSHALEQHRVDGSRFAAVCFTNLTQDHLDFHGTLDAYFEAKARLFMPSFASRAAINVDDERGRHLASRAVAAGLAVLTYGLEPTADVTATEVDLQPDHTTFTLHCAGVHLTLRSQLVGQFNVSNSLAAAATAYAAGLDLGAIGRGLEAPVVVPGRMERVETSQPFTVIVDYAHTPDALRNVLEAARPLTAPGGRVLVVFGCGGDRDRAKRPEMGDVATRLSDVAVITTDNARSEDPAAIASEVLAGVRTRNVTPRVELDRRIAIRAALSAARPGDVVVIAGKGHEAGQTIGGVTTPFDDRVVAREELEARV
jgi:UDP-N-acetylmuramoyl-L-alanyl-D-glutamate--2,6-diaminopimelate ligase